MGTTAGFDWDHFAPSLAVNPIGNGTQYSQDYYQQTGHNNQTNKQTNDIWGQGSTWICHTRPASSRVTAVGSIRRFINKVFKAFYWIRLNSPTRLQMSLSLLHVSTIPGATHCWPSSTDQTWTWPKLAAAKDLWSSSCRCFFWGGLNLGDATVPAERYEVLPTLNKIPLTSVRSVTLHLLFRWKVKNRKREQKNWPSNYNSDNLHDLRDMFGPLTQPVNTDIVRHTAANRGVIWQWILTSLRITLPLDVTQNRIHFITFE